MKKLLWVGDAGCQSGFARATHGILETLRQIYDVTVLGINYTGDPSSYPYPIYTTYQGGDGFGVGRLIWMCDLVKPDLIMIQQDGWNIPFYTRQLQKFPEYANVAVVAIVAVDGKNFRSEWLDHVTLAIFWTQFGLNEARDSGYIGPAEVISLGVDLEIYYPMDKSNARKLRGLSELPNDAYIVGNVNRNQPRKRWDLTIRYFAEWIKQSQVDNAYLYLHCAPTGDTGCDVVQLATYYGILYKVLLMQPAVFYGLNEEEMRHTYNCFDVQVTTTQGEGFGLTTFEGMACGIPQIVPGASALGELTKDAAYQIACTSTVIGPPYQNVIGEVADEGEFIEALDTLYRNENERASLASLAIARAREKQFRWHVIGREYIDALETVGVLA